MRDGERDRGERPTEAMQPPAKEAAAKSVLRMESRAVEDSDGKCLVAVEDTDTYKRGVQ